MEHKFPQSFAQQFDTLLKRMALRQQVERVCTLPK